MARRVRNPLQKESSDNTRLIRILLSLVFVFLAFFGGFLLRGNDALLDRLGFQTASDSDQNPGMTVSGSTYDSLSARLAEVQGILDAESLDSYDLGEATSITLNSLFDSTADDYLHYYNAEEYETYLKETSATQVGVGLLIGERDGAAYIVDVFNGSEAEAKGVESGDYIVAIDGNQGANGWTSAEAIKAIQNDEGETVTIKLRSPETDEAEGGEEYTVTLTCQPYDQDNVTSEVVEEDDKKIGYIKLAQITQDSDTLVESAINSVTDQGAQALILDLRDNPGGFLTQAVDIASLFIDSGVVVQIEAKETTSTRDATGAPITNLPLVVLVNNNTAGTAEVLAAALQESNVEAQVVGISTQGKGSVQSIHELSFGGALRYTSAYYKTPSGKDINGAGVSPQVVADNATDEDRQKSLALDTARSLIKD